MTTIDPSTNLGRLRLRLSDWNDIVILPDSVYNQTLIDTNNNLQQCVVQLGSMILGMLSQKVHRKLGTLEVFGNQVFDQYKQYLLMIIKDPAFSSLSPIPYSASGTNLIPLIEFQKNWRQNFYTGTQSQRMAVDAAISPNDDSEFGNFNLTGPQGPSFGWELNGSPP